MNKDFNNKSAKQKELTVQISEIRGQVHARLVLANRQLQAAAAGNKAPVEDSILGSFVLGMIAWVPLMDAMGVMMGGNEVTAGVFDGLANPAVCAVVDGVGVVWDQEANKRRSRKVEGYPMGRRQDPIFGKPMNHKFNMVSVNDNGRRRFRDAQEEVARMWDMIDVLDKLEAEGVSSIRVDAGAPMYDTLKTMGSALRGKSAVNRFSSAVRKAA